ncbi:cation diffusion facilitator family transporter [uncultured Corynebacterium sp.]|uniref:cation diffusion facilitator family transporter n=1 Tax=uncultured Corynebacterium sp. TaxID=159447 RepID=UPI0025D4AC89|nr:cation diffusion facilitator family transporter [uncultured Corynebacterium sp.]
MAHNMPPGHDHVEAHDHEHGDHGAGHEHGREHGHEHGVGHGHSHGHSHDHGASSRGRLIAALVVTATILLAELIGAWISGSLALAADAGHMLVDSSGLVIALIAVHLSQRPRNNRFTWGWSRAEVLAAALQAGMLIIICGVVAVEGISHLINQPDVEPVPMLVIGAIGLVANAASIIILAGGRESSLNMRAAFLEVVNDALGSLAVILAAIIGLATGWVRADSIASLFIVALMVPRAFILLRTAIRILMEATPDEIDLDDVREHICSVNGVKDCHDLHINTISTGVVALTAHVAVDSGLSVAEHHRILHTLEDCTAQHFPVAIKHTTFQLEAKDHSGHERLHHGAAS